MSFGPGASSKRRLKTLCSDMSRVVYRAYELTSIDFSVIEAQRSVEKQRENIKNGVSWTMDSDHLVMDIDQTGVLAVDLYPWVNGKTSHVRDCYMLLGKAMFKAAGQLSIEIKWGGFWIGNHFDGPHFAKRRQ